MITPQSPHGLPAPATTTRRRRGPKLRAERDSERAATPADLPAAPFPAAAHVPYDWTCAGCRRVLARTTIVPPLGTAMEIRCAACGTVDRLQTADVDGVVINDARRVLYVPKPLTIPVGGLYPARRKDGGE